MTDHIHSELQVSGPGAQSSYVGETGPGHLVGPPAGGRWTTFWLAVVLVALVTLGVVMASAGPATTPAVSPRTLAAQPQVTAPTAGEQVVAPLPVDAATLAALPPATTHGTVPDAPLDPAPDATPSGRLVKPTAVLPVYLAPGERAIAAAPARQWAGETRLPVIAEQPGWAQVLLPVRPQGATGWIYLDDPRVELERTAFRIEVDRTAFSLAVFDGTQQLGRWTVGIGKPEAPTPAGRTFVLDNLAPDEPRYSPVVLPLGTHSPTHTSYGGGPGTVGLHGWPTGDVFGQPSSDGCIRVPPDALQVLSTRVPLGSPVLIR